MKAWMVRDRKGYTDYAVIVFAETRGKAIWYALGTDEFPKSDWTFTEMSARRMPQLDRAYRGECLMDWGIAADRLDMVRLAGFTCDDDSFDPDECERCVAKDDCSKYAEYQEEEREDAHY